MNTFKFPPLPQVLGSTSTAVHRMMLEFGQACVDAYVAEQAERNRVRSMGEFNIEEFANPVARGGGPPDPKQAQPYTMCQNCGKTGTRGDLYPQCCALPELTFSRTPFGGN